MERRKLLQALSIAPLISLTGALAARAIAAPPKTMKEVEALQADWKSMLAPGTQVPSAA